MFEALLLRLQPFAHEFTKRGKQVYLVGGAVRNLLLGRSAEDLDFTTDARPDEVQTYFKRVLPTGLQHGTVTVLFQGEPFEVTTFRVDGTYGDGRRPDQVTFTPSLEEDLKRRDFTINSMALNLATGQLIDPHHGRQDLEQRILRAIGDPGQRFDEDALRILRFFRFASQLDFDLDDKTLAQVSSRQDRLGSVSKERIHDELVKAVAGVRPPRAWQPLAALGILDRLFAPLAVRRLTPDESAPLATLPPVLRWCYWLTLAAGYDEAAWEQALRRLAFSNVEVSAALGPARAWRVIREGGSVRVEAKAVVEAWGHRDRIEGGLAYLRALEAVGFWRDEAGWCGEIERAASSGEAIFQGELAINGRDVLEAGVATGPQVGQTLKRLQRLVWEDPTSNVAEVLRPQIRLR